MFGSCAEGTDAKESDVDLLILSDEKGLVKRITAGREGPFERRLAPIIMDINEYVQLLCCIIFQFGPDLPSSRFLMSSPTAVPL